MPRPQVTKQGVDRRPAADEGAPAESGHAGATRIEEDGLSALGPFRHLFRQLSEWEDAIDAGPLRHCGIRGEASPRKIVSTGRIRESPIPLRHEYRGDLRLNIHGEHGMRKLESREVEEVVGLAKSLAIGKALPRRREEDVSLLLESIQETLAPARILRRRKPHGGPLEEFLTRRGAARRRLLGDGEGRQEQIDEQGEGRCAPLLVTHPESPLDSDRESWRPPRRLDDLAVLHRFGERA